MTTALKSFLAVALMGVMVLAFSPAEAGAQKKKKKGNQITGSVVSVTTDENNKDKATITVKVQEKKKKKDANAVAAQPKEEKIKVDDKTKFEIKGKKKAPNTAATLADVKTNELITATINNGMAESVLITQKKKKKNT
jgi:hypothetical protein